MHDPAAQLLAALDPLSHTERIRTLVAWARAHRDEATWRALWGGDAWQRGLAVRIADVWGRHADLIAALSDPSLGVRRLAVGCCARSVPAHALAPALLGAALDTRRGLAHELARRRRADVAAAVAPTLLERGEIGTLRPLVGLLPWEVVARVEARLGPDRVPWRRLALAHPDATLDRLEGMLDGAAHRAEVERWWRLFEPAAHALVTARLDRLLDLLERYPPRTGWSLRGALGPLLKRAPDRTVAVIERLDPDAGWMRVGYRRRRHLASLDDALVARLAVVFARQPVNLATLLSALPPSRRDAAFAAARAVQPDALWDAPILRELPHERRHAEARRHRATPAVRGDVALFRRWAAWLPIDEATAELVPDGRPREREGDARAETWRLWIAALGLDRRGLDALLEASAFLKNEQDPVRLAVAQGLAGLPVSLLRAEHTGALEGFATAAFEARDTSYGTQRALEQLAARLVRAWAHEPDGPLFLLGLRILERNRARGRGLAVPRLDEGLRRGAEHAVVRAVLGWLRADTAREAPVSTLSLASALGERAWNVAELQALLGEIATTASDSGARQSATSLWLADPAHRDARVRAVLDADESAVSLRPVFEHLARRRQEWLDPFLQGRRLRGKWGSTKAGWVPWAPVAIERWLPRQQRALATQYRRIVDDPEHHVGTRAMYLRHLARIPAVRVGELVPYTRRTDVNVVEAALGGLVWCDEPAPALDVLLEHLDGDRARVAAYALPRLARLVPDHALEETLRGILEREKLKVTVHKEAVRLLGALRLPGAPGLLAREWARPKLHRDVRLALLHAAWARLDEVWAWEVLDQAAVHPDEEVPAALAAVTSLAVPAQHHGGLLERLLRLADHEAPEARLALTEHLARDTLGVGGADPAAAAEVAARLVVDEGPGSIVARSALGALSVCASLPGGAPAFARAVDALLAGADAEPIVSLDAEAPDRPVGRRLEALAAQIAYRTTQGRDRFSSLATALRDALLPRPVWFREAASVAAALWSGTAADADDLRALVAAAPSPLELAAVAHEVAGAVADPRRPWAVVDVLALDAALGEAGAPLRPALLEAAGTRHGWGRALRERLGLLRAHPVAGPEARRIDPC